MLKKQRLLCLFLAALMAVALAACGKDSGAASPSGSGQTSGQAQSSDSGGAQSGSGGNTGSAVTAEPAKLSGKLRLVELDDRDPSILRGVRINGLSAGSEEDINGKAPSLTDVRCIFELNEWVELYPDADRENELCVWVLRHRDDQEFYNSCAFSDEMPDLAACCELRYPADADNPDEWYWGSFYLNPDDCEAGYYDFVFTCEGKAIAALLTRFYAEGALSGRSGSELEALMHE